MTGTVGTEKGTMIRTRVKDIRISGRNTQGVTLMKTQNDKIISVAIVKSEEEQNEENIENNNDIVNNNNSAVENQSNIDNNK